MNRKGFTVSELLVAVVILAVIAVIPVELFENYKRAQLERFCLAHGYSRADWRWVGDNYCITRTDQTDVVVAQSKVK